MTHPSAHHVTPSPTARRGRRLAHTAIAMATVLACWSAANSAMAQVAGGTTTVGVSVTATTQLATGWSVRKTLMGKTIYNEANKKIGKVQDLIISTDKSVSYVIVGAGGFIGIGRHDVAVPVTQIEMRAGQLVMPGATVERVKAMPEFTYASDTTQRDQFVSSAENDIAAGRVKLGELERSAATAAADVKVRMDLQITALQADVKSAEAKLAEMKQANALRWKEFEAGVNSATAKLRKSINSAVG